MKLVPKSSKGDEAKEAEAVSYPWDAAMAALATGAYDIAGYPKDSRGPDQPAAQTPAPGTDPAGGKEEAVEGSSLTNMTKLAVTADDGGVAKFDDKVATRTEAAPQVAKPAAPAKAEQK